MSTRLACFHVTTKHGKLKLSRIGGPLLNLYVSLRNFSNFKRNCEGQVEVNHHITIK